MKRNTVTTFTSDLFYNGTPEQLEPYIFPCPGPPTCFCKAVGHLRSWAQRQLLEDWDRLDRQRAEAARWKAGLPEPETVAHLARRLHREGKVIPDDKWIEQHGIRAYAKLIEHEEDPDDR